jgi:predicted transcriptional regulator
MNSDTLMELTADIVSSHVGHNSVAAADLPRIIRLVYGALAASRQPAQTIEEKREPKVLVRSALRPDAITCLECGAKMKMLKRHLGSYHGLSPADYRTRWGLPGDYPMTAPNHSAMRQELAKKNGLGRKPGEKAGSLRTKVAAAADAE